MFQCIKPAFTLKLVWATFQSYIQGPLHEYKSPWAHKSHAELCGGRNSVVVIIHLCVLLFGFWGHWVCWWRREGGEEHVGVRPPFLVVCSNPLGVHALLHRHKCWWLAGSSPMGSTLCECAWDHSVHYNFLYFSLRIYLTVHFITFVKSERAKNSLVRHLRLCLKIDLCAPSSQIECTTWKMHDPGFNITVWHLTFAFANQNC